MKTKDKTPTSPADRQAARAHTWSVELISAPANWAGMITIDAPTREQAWTDAYAQCADRNARGEELLPQGVSLAPVTRTEHATLRAFTSGSSVRLRADRATGLESIEHRSGRVYVHAIYATRDVTDVDPETMARAGERIDHYAAQCSTPSPVTGKVYTTESERMARAIRCAAHDVPEAFYDTGRVAVWAWWKENTSPTFDATPDGLAQAMRCARLHGHGRATLRLDGMTIATMHSAYSGALDHEYGRPLLRVLNRDALAELGPRAVRIGTALLSVASMQGPHSRPDVEYAFTPAELDYAMTDPRDETPAPVLRETAPTLAEIHPELTDDHARALRMEAPHERLRTRLLWHPEELWKLAAENPAHFDHVPTTSTPNPA